MSKPKIRATTLDISINAADQDDKKVKLTVSGTGKTQEDANAFYVDLKHLGVGGFKENY